MGATNLMPMVVVVEANEMERVSQAIATCNRYGILHSENGAGWLLVPREAGTHVADGPWRPGAQADVRLSSVMGGGDGRT